MFGCGLGLGFDAKQNTAAFVPTSTTGCVIWLRADLGLSGSAWIDQASGLSFTGTMPSTTASINGKTALHFTAAGGTTLQTAHVSALNLAAYTAYLVLRPNISIPAFAAVMFKVSSGGWSDGYGFGNSGTPGELDGWSGVYTSFADAGAVSSGSDYAARFEFTGTTVTGYLNTTAGTSHAASQVNNSSVLQLGSAPGGSNFTGDICEILIYNRVLSSSEKTQISNYLFGRYNLHG